MIILVLAGGGGTRLWPLSRQDFPKQFLKFGDPQSLLQRTVSRFIKSPNVRKIVIATSEQYRSLVELQLKEIDYEERCDIIVEPSRKNTAPAIAFAVKHIEERYATEDELILVLPSDHIIEPEAVFLTYLDNARRTAEGKRMILFGINPSSPETGYGYIEVGKKIDSLTYEAKNFIEKPNLINAERYSKLPQYYWNSGMFLFSIRTFWRQLELHAPDIYAIVKNGSKDASINYASFPDISIDYALMEKSKDILICPLPIEWSDVGSWDSVYETLDQDSDQNVFIGNVQSIDTRGSLVLSGKRLISTIGLENLLIIETADVILICKRGESQKVKGMVQNLVNQGFKEGSNHRIGSSS